MRQQLLLVGKAGEIAADHFVLPYKRYAGQTLLDLSATYLENDGRSYRQKVRPRGRVTGYQTPAGASVIEERALHPMTVWRMLTWLGCQLVALARGRQLIQEHTTTRDQIYFFSLSVPKPAGQAPRGRFPAKEK